MRSKTSFTEKFGKQRKTPVYYRHQYTSVERAKERRPRVSYTRKKLLFYIQTLSLYTIKVWSNDSFKRKKNAFRPLTLMLTKK